MAHPRRQPQKDMRAPWTGLLRPQRLSFPQSSIPHCSHQTFSRWHCGHSPGLQSWLFKKWRQTGTILKVYDSVISIMKSNNMIRHSRLGSWTLVCQLKSKFCCSYCVTRNAIMGFTALLVCDLNRTPIVMAKHRGSRVHFTGISTCGRTSPETVSHPQRQPLPTPCKISLPVYVILTNKRLQPLTTTLYNSLVLSFTLLKI